MNKSSTSLAYAALIALMLLGVWALAFTTDIKDSGLSGVSLPFPNQVEDWTGSEIRFCITPQCEKVYLRSEVGEEDRCPACGQPLSGGSRVEWSLLPADTRIHKVQYTQPGRPPIMAAAVLSGASRTSIHRPQICLVGDGNEIVKTQTIKVNLPGRAPLQATVLDMLTRRQKPDGSWSEYPSYYAYWFVSPDHETPHHTVRMFWMAYDRIFRGTSHRWAYISVSGWRDPRSRQHLDQAADFIAGLYPSIARPLR